MHVLVTGSNGFIARSLIRKLLEEGHGVYGLDIVQTSKELFAPYQNNFLSIIGDITNPDFEVMFDVLKEQLGVEFDFCFHLAAMANVDEVREHRDKAFQVNLYGTFNIIEVCRKRNIPFAFASTACVYGYTKQHPSTEEGETLPVDWYGVTKRAGEELVKGLLKHWLILRFGTTFGAEMRPALCTHIFLKQAIRKERFTIRGSGEQTRNWVYIDDLVDGCIKAMKYNLTFKENHIFNLAGTHSYTVKFLAYICNKIVNNDSQYEAEFLLERPDDVFNEDISNQKAKTLLGWMPNTSLEEGLRKIYEEWKKWEN